MDVAAVFLFIVLFIINIHLFGFELAYFNELFNNFLAVFNLTYSAVAELGSIDCNHPLLLLSSVVPTKLDENSAQKPKRLLSKAERAQFELPENLKEILVGCLLGDLHCRDRYQTGNITLYFEQGNSHKEYIFHLFELFEGYCSSTPKISDRQPDKRTGKVYTRIVFTSYSLPCFNYLYELFYREGKKVVPLNIANLLTPTGLAYLIAEDGSFQKTHSIVILCTDSFSLEEVTLLVNTLNEKFNLECYVYKERNSYRIKIPKRSLPILQSLLKNIMPIMMLHKIGL